MSKVFDVSKHTAAALSDLWISTIEATKLRAEIAAARDELRTQPQSSALHAAILDAAEQLIGEASGGTTLDELLANTKPHAGSYEFPDVARRLILVWLFTAKDQALKDQLSNALADRVIDTPEATAIQRAIAELHRCAPYIDETTRDFVDASVAVATSLVTSALAPTTLDALMPPNAFAGPRKFMTLEDKVLIDVLSHASTADGTLTAVDQQELSRLSVKSDIGFALEAGDTEIHFHEDGSLTATNLGTEEQKMFARPAQTDAEAMQVFSGAFERQGASGTLVATPTIYGTGISDGHYNVVLRTPAGKLLACGEMYLPPVSKDQSPFTKTTFNDMAFVKRGTWTTYDVNGNPTGTETYSDYGVAQSKK